MFLFASRADSDDQEISDRRLSTGGAIVTDRKSQFQLSSSLIVLAKISCFKALGYDTFKRASCNQFAMDSLRMAMKIFGIVNGYVD